MKEEEKRKENRKPKINIQHSNGSKEIHTREERLTLNRLFIPITSVTVASDATRIHLVATF